MQVSLFSSVLINRFHCIHSFVKSIIWIYQVGFTRQRPLSRIQLVQLLQKNLSMHRKMSSQTGIPVPPQENVSYRCICIYFQHLSSQLVGHIAMLRQQLAGYFSSIFRLGQRRRLVPLTRSLYEHRLASQLFTSE